jgi:hypothetical protein
MTTSGWLVQKNVEDTSAATTLSPVESQKPRRAAGVSNTASDVVASPGAKKNTVDDGAKCSPEQQSVVRFFSVCEYLVI